MVDLRRRFFLFGATAAAVVVPARKIFIMPKLDLTVGVEDLERLVGASNTAVGYATLSGLTAGISNVAVGLTRGLDNVAVGYSALTWDRV